MEKLLAELKSWDEYTYSHSVNVFQLALSFGVMLGLSTRELKTLGQGALYHDIGKLCIPQEILRKPSALNQTEYSLIKTHPEHGIHIARHLPPESLAVIAQHHEYWDGTGYPRGLKGEEIHHMARLVAVADVWDALISKRPYSQPWPPHEVIEYLRRLRGKQFDPQIVDLVCHTKNALL